MNEQNAAIKPYVIGLDLGGTNSVFGIVDARGEIKATTAIKTGGYDKVEDYVDACVEALQVIIDQVGGIEKIKSMGIGAPNGNFYNGTIEFAPNLPWAHDGIVPLAKLFSERLNNIPVALTNDANAAAYGEFVAGAAKGSNNAVCITLGTGVGGGIVIDKKIYSGSNFAGAEIGHMVIDPNGPACTCGRRGCFEVFSSATGLIRMTKEAMDEDPTSIMHKMTEEAGKVSACTAFNAMREGDKAGKAVVDKYIRYLACGITNTINIFQPDILCIGGGVCNEGDPLLLPLKELVAKEVYTRASSRNCDIVIAKLGNDAGIIGAAFLGLNRG